MNYVEWNNLYENTEKLVNDVVDALYFQFLVDTVGRVVVNKEFYSDFLGVSREGL